MVQSAWDHAVMSDELHHNITNACRHFTDDSGESDISYEHKKDECDELLDLFFQTFGDNIDLYSLYCPICTNSTNSAVHRHHAGLQYIGYDPCARHYSEAYLNRADVQRALHADATRNGRWKRRHGRPHARGIHALRKLKLETLQPWRKWFAAGEDQMAGFTVTYKGGLVYATVRGAGHAVPEFAPVQVRQLFSHFLAGRELPAKPKPAGQIQ
ncbi:hypothetical protein PR202_ga12129 [Eleusine coracana subsp. coracana]|uniref:Uncharacterized protein n=1 Tax=Eleusine coracana subsp. coracana TaxID=191504 RepID=A0AAV5CBF8_ELECO|nr:hypothetical protein PR202_ga12129 [Eleusine coracana subsp. coracana]